MTHQAEGSQRTPDDADLEFAYEVNAWKSRLINQAASLTGMFETNAMLREQLAAMKALHAKFVESILNAIAAAKP